MSQNAYAAELQSRGLLGTVQRRLNGAFAGILLLFAVVLAATVWKAEQVRDLSQQMRVKASKQELASEWLALFRVAPIRTAGLVAASALSIVASTPAVWLARALL